MSDNHVFSVPTNFAVRTHCTNAKYQAMYHESVKNPVAFWAEQASRLDWIRVPSNFEDNVA